MAVDLRPANVGSPVSANSTLVRRVLLLALVVAFTANVTRFSWYGDDWLITLRTALNAHAGNGLTFNVGERVAGFTHPLWLLVILLIGSLTGSWVQAVILANVALAATAAAVLLLRTRTTSAVVFVGLTLIASHTVAVWSTGGLEGPLAAAIIVVIVALASWCEEGGFASFAWGALGGLLALTRLDSVLIVAPLAVVVLWGLRRRPRVVGLIAVGFLSPVVAWAGFSWTYYGTLLPNTFMAKTNVHIPASSMIGQGLFYLRYSLDTDPVLWVALVTAGLAVILTRSAKGAALILGASGYLGYVVWIAGDFMAGRFLYLPVMASLAAIMECSRHPRRISPWWNPGFVVACVVSACVALVHGFVSPSTPQTPAIMVRGVVDERAFWVSNAGTSLTVAPSSQPLTVPGMDPQSIQKAAAGWPTVRDSIPRVVDVEYAAIGQAGITRGPATHIIDLCALTDRFLAQQSFEPVPGPPTPMDRFFLSGPGWRVGHYARTLPEGYVDAVTWADPTRMPDPEDQARLRELWLRIGQ